MAQNAAIQKRRKYSCIIDGAQEQTHATRHNTPQRRGRSHLSAANHTKKQHSGHALTLKRAHATQHAAVKMTAASHVWHPPAAPAQQRVRTSRMASGASAGAMSRLSPKAITSTSLRCPPMACIMSAICARLSPRRAASMMCLGARGVKEKRLSWIVSTAGGCRRGVE